MATLSAAQRRAAARPAYNAFVSACPSRDMFATLGGKWTTLVLATLGEGGLRYNEISRRIGGVSTKMLTQTLRTLERDGLITRHVTPTVPVQVDYALTHLGRDLLSVVATVQGWAEANAPAIRSARARFDATELPAGS